MQALAKKIKQPGLKAILPKSNTSLPTSSFLHMAQNLPLFLNEIQYFENSFNFFFISIFFFSVG